MRKLFLSIIVAGLVAFCAQVQAQSGKLGHINSMELMQMMPEMDSMQRVLQDYSKELQDNYAMMQTEIQNKYTEFQNNQSQWSDLIKQTKGKEIQDLQVRAQEFLQQAEEDYQKKTQDLLTPITEKVKKAIEEVASEGKFSYILDSSNGTVFMGSEAIDVTSSVKKKLGLPDVPATNQMAPVGK